MAMASVKPSFSFLSLLFAFAFFSSFMPPSTYTTEARTTFTEQKQRVNGTWCIAKPSAEEKALMANVDYSCKQKGVDCRDIVHGGACFNPNTPASHASVAMNLYYKAAGMHDWNCYFNATGILVHDDPSVGDCEYA